MNSSVTITAPCDRCGHPDATWTGHRPDAGGTIYTAVDCPTCVGWTVRAQAVRRLARVVELPLATEPVTTDRSAA